MEKILSSIAKTFAEEWATAHTGRQPIGWTLWKDRSLPWVRFHALPGSKRYAENEVEDAIILSRANELGDRILGSGSECWLVEARCDRQAGAGEYAGYHHEPDESRWEGVDWRFYVQSVKWNAGEFDALLLEIADYCASEVLWMARNEASIFAPYDGGFDLFPTTHDEVVGLKENYSDWLSDTPSGH